MEEGKASSGEGSEQQKQAEPISETFHAESDLQVRSGWCKLNVHYQVPTILDDTGVLL